MAASAGAGPAAAAAAAAGNQLEPVAAGAVAALIASGGRLALPHTPPAAQ